jgi:hypothetical protein
LLFGTCQGHSEDFVGPGVATTLRRNPSMLVIIIFGCERYAIRTRARAARNERTEATPPRGGAYRARRGCFRAQVRTQTDGIRSQDAKTLPIELASPRDRFATPSDGLQATPY